MTGKDDKNKEKLAKESESSGLSGHLPGGVGVSIQQSGERTELVVSGLKADQLKRILPQVNKEVLIAIAEEESPLGQV